MVSQLPQLLILLGAYYSLPSLIVRTFSCRCLRVAVVSIVAIILQSRNLLCPESMSLAFGNSWLQIVKVISVTIATFFLIEFYFVIRKDIAYDLEKRC